MILPVKSIRALLTPMEQSLLDLIMADYKGQAEIAPYEFGCIMHAIVHGSCARGGVFANTDLLRDMGNASRAVLSDNKIQEFSVEEWVLKLFKTFAKIVIAAVKNSFIWFANDEPYLGNLALTQEFVKLVQTNQSEEVLT